MVDFVEEFGALIEAATTDAIEAQQAAWRERAHKLAAAEDLLRHTEGRFAELARNHRKTLKYDRGRGSGGAFHDLIWLAPPPSRTLRVMADQAEGTFRVAWRADQRDLPWATVDLHSFDRDRLDQIIVGLADQKTWQSGEVPALPGLGSALFQ